LPIETLLSFITGTMYTAFWTGSVVMISPDIYYIQMYFIMFVTCWFNCCRWHMLCHIVLVYPITDPCLQLLVFSHLQCRGATIRPDASKNRFWGRRFDFDSGPPKFDSIRVIRNGNSVVPYIVRWIRILCIL